jgi:hypothetical protein
MPWVSQRLVPAEPLSNKQAMETWKAMLPSVQCETLAPTLVAELAGWPQDWNTYVINFIFLAVFQCIGIF